MDVISTHPIATGMLSTFIGAIIFLICWFFINWTKHTDSQKGSVIVGVVILITLLLWVSFIIFIFYIVLKS